MMRIVRSKRKERGDRRSSLNFSASDDLASVLTLKIFSQY